MLSTTQKPAVLVMTATITPPEGMPGSVRSDPTMRLDDYSRALKFYLSLPSCYVDRILFLENSGSDLSALRQVAKSVEHDKKVEFIGFIGDYKPEFGKGYGEFNMLDYGLSQYRFFSKTDVLWKVTGRLQILNLAHLIKTAPQDYTVYCDLRSVPFISESLGGNNWMDLRLFSCTVEAYDRLLRSRYLEMTYFQPKFVNPEKYLFGLMRKAMNEDKKLKPRFRVQPVIAGYGGYGNANYQGLTYKTKEFVRAAARLTAPWLWL